MSKCRRALHIRTGDHGNAYAINRWLERHNVRAVNCNDVFEACVILLEQPDLTPDLTLIGTRWLNPDDYTIAAYLRQTWPGVTIVLYGSESVRLPMRDERIVICRTSAALREMLAGTPHDLLGSGAGASKGGGDSADRPSASQRGAEPPPAGSGDEAQAGSEDRPGSNDQRANSPSILTRDELAALLDDE